MANHKSAIKQLRHNVVRRLRNRNIKSAARGRVRQVREALTPKKREEAAALLKEAVSKLHRAASKRVIPKKRASRIVSRLAKAINRLG